MTFFNSRPVQFCVSVFRLFWCPLNPQTVTIYHRHLVHKHGLNCPSIFRLFWSTYLTWYFMILHACHNFLVPAAHRSAALWDSCASTTKPNCLERPCKLHKGYPLGFGRKAHKTAYKRTSHGSLKPSSYLSDITWRLAQIVLHGFEELLSHLVFPQKTMEDGGRTSRIFAAPLNQLHPWRQWPVPRQCCPMKVWESFSTVRVYSPYLYGAKLVLLMS